MPVPRRLTSVHLWVLLAGVACGLPDTSIFDNHLDQHMRTTHGQWLDRAVDKFAGRINNKKTSLTSPDEGHVVRLEQQHRARAAAQAAMKQEALHFPAQSMLCTAEYSAAHEDFQQADQQIANLFTSALQSRLDEVTQAALNVLDGLQRHAVNTTVPRQLPKGAQDSAEKQTWLLFKLWGRGVSHIGSLMRVAYDYVENAYIDELESTVMERVMAG